MKILITGASGFIGSNLLRLLSQKNHVYALVRNKKETACTLKVKYLEVDLSQNDFVKCLPLGIDKVIHLAQSYRYRDFPDGVEDMVNINLNSTVSLLNWAKKNGVKHFIFSSTANVYSQTDEILTEESKTIPNSFYGASKLASELILAQYKNFFSVDILRLFTVYGPGQKGMLIPQIIEKIKLKNEIHLSSNIGIKFTPIFIDDLVLIINKILLSSDDNGLRIMNVCGNQQTTLLDVVSEIEKILGVSSSTSITKDKPLNFIGSNELLFSKIDSVNFTDLKNGLNNTILA